MVFVVTCYLMHTNRVSKFVYRMIELQRRLAQDYQRQRDYELNHQMAQATITDQSADEQTILARRADVERFGNRSPQTNSPAARDLQAPERVHIIDRFAGTDHLQLPARSVTAGQQLPAGWQLSDVAGHRQRGSDGDRQLTGRVHPMSYTANNGSATVDDFVLQLKSRSAK